MVVSKPAGLRSVPSAHEHASVLTAVAEAYPEAAGPLICHRLDHATSGLMVLALDSETHRRISIAFEKRQVEKRYTALLEGRPPATEGVIDLPLMPDFVHRPWQRVDRFWGKPSQSRYTVLGFERSSGEAVTRVEMTPVTGRTHQLRLHAAHPAEDDGLGCPMLGDALYGGGNATAPRLCLHAHLLGFDDPNTGEPLTFECPAPF